MCYFIFMFDKGAEIIPDMIVLHDDGLTYRVDKVVASTDAYEEGHTLPGVLRVAYTQLENADFPAGTEWNKDGEEFRKYFTPVPVPQTPVANYGIDPIKLRQAAMPWNAEPS